MRGLCEVVFKLFFLYLIVHIYIYILHIEYVGSCVFFETHYHRIIVLNCSMGEDIGLQQSQFTYSLDCMPIHQYICRAVDMSVCVFFRVSTTQLNDLQGFCIGN